MTLPPAGSFPALIAPASLKRSRRKAMRGASRRFSGVNCAGLIEARWLARALTGYRSFPALIAPASLKHDPADRNVRNKRRFPALIAPASLKQPVRAIWPEGIRCFPALIAPASLKHLGQMYFDGKGVTRFPALIAPASLKQGASLRPRPCAARVFRR